MTDTMIASLGRIADFADNPWDEEPVDQRDWATGDYVVGEVTGAPSALYQVECSDGEVIPVQAGQRVLGALGVRAATLEGVGSWRDVKDGKLQALTSAGLMGAFTSVSSFIPKPMTLDYIGHVRRNGANVRMQDFAIRNPGGAFDVPVVLIVGTSMSAGKTVTGALVCQVLAEAGLRVVGAKLTGAGRYQDILRFRNAGAVECYDFVDAGLPSTVVDQHIYLDAIRPLLRHIATREPDYVVVEAGASPLEPYNGAALVEEIGAQVCCRILSASDPYAVVGVQQAFRFTPDLVTGPATNTTAAIDLLDKLTHIPAVNVIASGAEDALREFLAGKLGRNLDQKMGAAGSD